MTFNIEHTKGIMSANIILTHHVKDPFARVSKQLLNDPAISFKAKGILAYLLGKPEDWKLRVSDLENHSSDGKDSIRSALNELRAAGYAKFERIKKKGVIVDGVWKICDFPIFSPRTGFPDVDKPDEENRYLSKNECTKNERTKSKETKETPPSDGASVPAVWNPSHHSKEGQLARVKPPKDYPSQKEFECFMDEHCGSAFNYRPDLYLEICRNKWHKWSKQYNHWRPIRDWRVYVLTLNDTIEEAARSKRSK